MPCSPPRTVGQRWRRRRALVIVTAWREGLTQRLLASVFDLSAQRVSEIIAEMTAPPVDRPARPTRARQRTPWAPELASPARSPETPAATQSG